MILMHRALNIVFPLAMLILLLIILPPYLVFKLLSYIKRSIFSENVAGKVVLITGASSGIGEDLAYEYAVRGARLALVARREDRLRAVADKARNLGSPNVFHVRADVSKVEDCKRIIDETLNHFGHLDHLVNNAGISQAEYFEDCTEVSDLTHIMDVNFWGSAFCSRFAIPHLKRSKGKIVVISSVAPWSRTPKLSVYNASKAALISFYDTLRVEIGSHIGITIVMPGLIDTEMTSPSSLAKAAKAVIIPPYLVFKLLSYIKRSMFTENVAGKVVLITGASSGIGEVLLYCMWKKTMGLAYEYARRGARLALVARREDRLREVADKAHELGSPEAVVIRADVAKVEDCKRIVDEAVNHFGHLDHLVSNAGILRAELFENCKLSDFAPILGICLSLQSVSGILRKSRGKIVAITSVAAWVPTPRATFYNASKAALVSFYETLRVECDSHIGITIVLPGLIESEMTVPDSLSKFQAKFLPPIESTRQCAEAIVHSACRGDMYLTEPSWSSSLFMLKLLCPELFDWFYRWNFMSGSKIDQL
ncbi:PREDICTED: 11-beta-hydroxysteroid dehydrogenase-like 4A [Populus euphratica]|uniref:11-beta-hydroxysteroid dehydrogenase-like 4A n=1 Tax=Populus euphratica TaxID=75702 RepID=A0AAJ6UR01_POPEU|nr:PREDICTED: 11-beta-hydroxysteroid dehydrogenase-like 4A [Populus euphratica]